MIQIRYGSFSQFEIRTFSPLLIDVRKEKEKEKEMQKEEMFRVERWQMHLSWLIGFARASTLSIFKEN